MVLDFLDMMLLPRAVVYEEVLSYHELSSTKSYRLPRTYQELVYQELSSDSGACVHVRIGFVAKMLHSEVEGR
jgi:hypothetical protein